MEPKQLVLEFPSLIHPESERTPVLTTRTQTKVPSTSSSERNTRFLKAWMAPIAYKPSFVDRLKGIIQKCHLNTCAPHPKGIIGKFPYRSSTGMQDLPLYTHPGSIIVHTFRTRLSSTHLLYRKPNLSSEHPNQTKIPQHIAEGPPHGFKLFHLKFHQSTSTKLLLS